MQSSRPVRALYLFVLVPFVGCGSHSPTDFNDPDRAGAGAGGSGAPQGGSAGTGGVGGALSGGASGASGVGGAAGTAQAGGGAGGIPIGGSAGAPGGAAGTGLGGTTAGIGGMPPNGGGPSGGTSGARGGTGGSGTVSFSCGSLMCVADRQYCVRTLPAISGQPEMRMCLPFPDSCGTINCDCFCKAPTNSPCGAASACMCTDNNGQISVLCGGA